MRTTSGPPRVTGDGTAEDHSGPPQRTTTGPDQLSPLSGAAVGHQETAHGTLGLYGIDGPARMPRQRSGPLLAYLPSILLRSALWRSGFSSASRLRSVLAQTMKAFMGRRMRASLPFSLAARPGAVRRTSSLPASDGSRSWPCRP